MRDAGEISFSQTPNIITRMPRQTPAAGSRELFRYARVVPPRVLDLNARLAAYRETRPLLPNDKSDEKQHSKERVGWATQFLNSENFVSDFDDLHLPLSEFFEGPPVPEDRLPSRQNVKHPKKLASFIASQSKELARSQERVTLSLFACAVLGRKRDVERLNRILQFLELLPNLSKVERRSAYAPAILNRDRRSMERPSSKKQLVHPKPAKLTVAQTPASAREILEIWEITNEFLQWKRRSLEEEIEKTKQQKFKPPAVKGRSTKKTNGSRSRRKSFNKEYRAYIAAKSERLKSLGSELKTIIKGSLQERLSAMKHDKAFQTHAGAKYGKWATNVIGKVDLPDEPIHGFCELYSKKKGAEVATPTGPRKCIYKSGDPCVEELSRDEHALDANDDVRPLGLAELITVEERWLSYLPGEISAIENILKGEVRKKKVKSTKYFEEVTERMTQEVEEKEAENQSKTKQDLNSQIESELSSRFNSDINASLSGSGGGTIGVVNLTGGASLGAAVGVGLDTRFSSSDESNFSQEIVSRAVERTKKMTTERRLSRSVQLYETLNYHEINNTGDGAAHTNAIYCFLDKRICITETVYGLRKFLNAEIIHPGADLVKTESQRHVLNLNDVGLPPTFDVSPNDITPENYLDLVGKLRASNISPPPPYVKVVSKTYKTDITNENKEPNDISFKKVAEVLAPFFGQYKRFLIQDKIEIPEGYRVQEVKVTVTHGRNGMSIPAHLPFSLLGAFIFALPVIGVAMVPPYTLIYLPLAVWQVLFAASPVLHYNADSSNVTVNVGHQTEESPYFFFQPDFLIREVVDALGNSSVITQNFLDFLQEKLTALYQSFTSGTNNGVVDALTDMTDEMKTAINDFIRDLQNWLKDLVVNIIPNLISGGSASGPTLPRIPSIDAGVIAAVPAAILAPFRRFFDDIVAHLEALLGDALGDVFEYLNSMMDNTDTKIFSGAKGFTEVLPVSFNCIALKPGVTINLSVCMVRIDELALDTWRLETFDRLNQAYYQLAADYENRRNQNTLKSMQRASPGLMRQEEMEVIKNRVIRSLHHKYSTTPDAPPSLDELQLFEHAIDWENVSFRLFNYGPSGQQVAQEKLGFYAAADERRKQFMNSLWSQVLLPLQEDQRLEQVMIHFLENGTVDFESDLLAALADGEEDPMNELTEIYRDLVLKREQITHQEPVCRQEIIPTELVVIFEPDDGESFPKSPIPCGEDV
jgi:hypothetical protein